MMNQNDDKLRALLKQWRDIEPSGNFEANVWRRIRLAEAPEPARITFIELLRRLVTQPAWSVAVAVVIGLTAGIWGGVASVPRQQDTSKAELQFLASGTLAGSYAQMAAKETR